MWNLKIKPDIKKLMNAIKAEPKKELLKSLNAPGVRDMRQEAIDMGSHGAADYFTGGTA